jgi:zinc protease
MLRFVAAALCAVSGALWAQNLNVSEHTLANGMKILIHEDHDLPSVAMHFFFKVGSRNERPGTTGLSHFFEHMMFNGAKKYGPKQFDIQMEKNGGSNNGYTTNDLTSYTDWFPPSALELMMDMESDRIRDLAFDPKMVESERGVVSSERRMSVENNNMQLLMEHLEATAFMAHPYGWPVIGWMSDIEAWTMQDLQNHFRMGYAPNNCVMAIAGDVRPAEVLRLARKYLEPIPRHDPPPKVTTREPKQMGERRVIVRKEAQAPMLMAAYHVMQASAADRPALDLLSNILTEGRTSRLRARLVEREQLAVSVDAFAGDTIDPGLLIVMARPRAGVDVAKLEAALYEELEAVREKGVTPREVEKARNQILTGIYQEMARISGKARLLGEYEVLHGDYRKLFSAAAELAKAGPAEVQRVAKQYLEPDNRTVATLIPTAAAGGEKKEAAQ